MTYLVLECQVQASSGEKTCMQEGNAVNYECTVTDTYGIGSTIWTGDAFKCVHISNQITLSHRWYDRYINLGQTFECGNFSAMGVDVNGSTYTSRLSFFGDIKLNGTVINCTFSNGMLIKTIIVKIEG